MRRAWILGFVLPALISGCGGGGGSDQQSARDIAQSYVEARNQGDAAEVCELYSEQLIKTLKTSNCVAFVREQTSGTATDLTLVGVRQNGDRATADDPGAGRGQRRERDRADRAHAHPRERGVADLGARRPWRLEADQSLRHPRYVGG